MAIRAPDGANKHYGESESVSDKGSQWSDSSPIEISLQIITEKELYSNQHISLWRELQTTCIPRDQIQTLKSHRAQHKLRFCGQIFEPVTGTQF